MASQCGSRTQTGLDVWMAQGPTSSDGPVSATLSGTPENAAIVVVRYSGVNPAGPIGNLISANTGGPFGDCNGGSDAAAYSQPLSTTGDGAVAFAAVAMRQREHTPGSGWTERIEFRQGSGGGSASG